MTTPFQTGIIAEASSDALFITLNLDRSEINNIKTTLASTPAIIYDIQQEFPDSDLHASIGLSHRVWHHFDSKKPNHLANFPSIKGKEVEITPTDVDLVFHIRSSRHDATYQLGKKLYSAFGSNVSLVDEVKCFKYKDNRDLTGFVDGTENPEGEQRKKVALVGNEDPDFTDGTYLNLMRFVHNLDKWEKEDLKTQEDIYGRTKKDNEEYTAAEKSVHAHTKRTALKDDNGNAMEILRHSMPFASLTEQGLMFASYSKSPEPFNRMLESMIKGDEDGNTDHLMRYTTAKTGQAFFVPAIDWFTSL